ncbi:MAG TPA: orotate phosphoribosyltransferase [bacterium]|nr:orotate phosphoribosyltransferase [bacterium]
MNKREELIALLHEKSFRTGEFTLTSGKKSNYYIDVRATSTDPRGAALIGDLLLERIASLGGVDAVAGMVLGAVPVVMGAVARSVDAGAPVSALLVRKEAKGHGRGKRLEGTITPGMRVLIVDDVATTAGSTLKTIEAVLDEVPAAKIVGVVAVVDRNEGGREAVADAGYELTALVTVDELFALGERPVE